VTARVRKEPVAGRGLRCDAREPIHDKIVPATIKNDANSGCADGRISPEMMVIQRSCRTLEVTKMKERDRPLKEMDKFVRISPAKAGHFSTLTSGV
jgi:hypothetical protein